MNIQISEKYSFLIVLTGNISFAKISKSFPVS